ncbi:MAG TPA: 2OG-Fe(II) oxygenase [Sphingomicrobium sp.]|nr:2OG-Fe(II) oxygenase [Sphingomicrobium sp.]
MTSLQQAIALINAGRSDEGVQALRQIASSGDPQALLVLADMTWSGNVVAQDPARGRLLFEYAAALGHGQAAVIATNLLASGIAGKRDWPLALKRLAEEGRTAPQRRAAANLIGAMDLDDNGDPRAIPPPLTVADEPYARLFERLFTTDECKHLINVVQHLFEPSMVYRSGKQAVRDTIRTSDGAPLHWLIEDPAVTAINRRIAAATQTDYDRGEALQVLRYSPRQEYRPHFDFLEGVANPRPWTALIYLNDDYEGGETEFVKTGVKVRGTPGDMLVFRNSTGSDVRDPLAEHAGLPVTSGTKFLATRWIRAHRWIP